MNLQERIQLLTHAIEHRHRLRIVYSGKERLGEPQCLGESKRGTVVLRVYQIRGGSHPEALLDVAKVTTLELLDEHFDEPGPHYRRNDSAMRRIICQL
ncbi:hypothetical protein [Fulvimonas yonginensis]|uniref:WYL domain-containing protein n=1 Tax=Fulvimonas yonginensis TaxID=1495200 RepID=A0ABU8JB51_9GAMM